MEDIRELLLSDIGKKLNGSELAFKIGDVIMTQKSAFELRTQEGFKINVTKFIPAMPIHMKGTMVPVDGITLFKYDVVLEFFVKEMYLDQFKSQVSNIVRSEFVRKKASLTETLECMYNAGEPIHDRTEIFNKDKVAIFSIPITALVGEGLNFGSETRVYLRYQGTYIPLPVYGGSVNVAASSAGAQVIGNQKTTSVNTSRGWACTAELYYVRDNTIDELFSFIRTESEQNRVFDLKIEYDNLQIDERKVIITNISTPLLSERIRTFVISFSDADEVLYNGS